MPSEAERIVAATALVALLAIAASVSFAQSPGPEEYDIKAVFLYNFTRYVEWPEEPGVEGFAIAVFGDSNIVAPLREVAKKKSVGALRILVRTCLDPGQIGRPRILFIARSASSKLDQILKATKGADILTVSEAEGSARADGVAINFVLKEGAVKFEISEKALDRTRLKVGSQLLKLAILVDGPGERQG